MTASDLAAKRVLVVDDELTARRLVVRILKGKDFECASAASVPEARGLLEAQSYALLITDMRMWGEEGLELIRFVTEEYPDMATIMVSGQDEGELEKRALQAGATFFIRKPLVVEDLLEKVEAALDGREEAIKLRKHQEW